MARKPSSRKTAVLASIVEAEEHNATSAAVIDHGTQIGSWTPAHVAEQQILDAAVDQELDNLSSLGYAAPSSVTNEDAPEVFDCGDFAVNLSDDELDAIAELHDPVGLYLSHDDNMDAATVLRSDEPPAEESAAPQAANEIEEQPKTLGELLASFDDDAVTDAVVQIADAIDGRSTFETEKNPDNLNIHRTIKKVRDQMVTKRAARLLMSVKVDPSFINRQVHSGAAYNVYALGKLGDVIKGVTDGIVANAINLACMRSLFAFREAGATFTMECAKGAASKQYAARHVDAAIRKHLISHTVSTSTAPTQASSTMQALETLGVVRRSGGGKNPIYTLTDAPIVAKLETLLAA